MPLRDPRPDTTGLPPHVVAELNRIAREFCDMPREFCRDMAEQVHWRARLARRLRAVAASRVPVAPAGAGPAGPKPPSTASAARPARLSAREQAEAVFGKAPPTVPTMRTITSKGRQVRAETRRARAAGQMELRL